MYFGKKWLLPLQVVEFTVDVLEQCRSGIHSLVQLKSHEGSDLGAKVNVHVGCCLLLQASEGEYWRGVMDQS